MKYESSLYEFLQFPVVLYFAISKNYTGYQGYGNIKYKWLFKLIQDAKIFNHVVVLKKTVRTTFHTYILKK
jgi:hypothetical protein